MPKIEIKCKFRWSKFHEVFIANPIYGMGKTWEKNLWLSQHKIYVKNNKN